MNTHDHNRKLTPSERKEIAFAFGWEDVDGVRDNLVGMRPMYDDKGEHYGWMDEQRIPNYDYDTLRFVRLTNSKDQP